MRVLLVANGFPPADTGGVELYTASVAEAIARAGHDVSVFAGSPSAAESLHERTSCRGIEVERVAAPGRDQRLRLHEPMVEAAFAKALARARPDVVHLHHLQFLSARLISRARAGGVPSVVTVHDHWMMCPEIQPFHAWAHPLSGRWWGLNCLGHLELAPPRRLAAMIIRRRPLVTAKSHLRRPALLRTELAAARLLIFPSRFLLERHRRFGLDGVVLAHGVPPVVSKRTPRVDGEIRVGFLGALVPAKGADLIVRAFRDVDPSNARLLLQGPAIRPVADRRLARLIGGDPRIEVAPALAHDDVARFFSRVDLVVVPSRAQESFSLVTREAFSAGLPVLASDAGALPEVVVPGRNGELFRAGSRRDLGRRLRALLEPGRLACLTAFPAVKTVDAHAVELLAIYGAAATGPAPAPRLIRAGAGF